MIWLGGGESWDAQVPQLEAAMQLPLLYRQLLDQLRPWILPKDRRHLQSFAEIVTASCKPRAVA